MERPLDAIDDVPAARRIFCNRTLNLRAIKAIGFDMDYTLVHYHVERWERRSFELMRERLSDRGWPVDGIVFDPAVFVRGLIIDRELGNLVKVNRFGQVKRAMHGLRLLDFDEMRRAYGRTFVDLGEPRWIFLNTLFSHSESCMFTQYVERLDAGHLPGVMGYGELYDRIKGSLDREHMAGRLKGEIIADPDRYVVADPELPGALLDLKDAGKRLLLVTNSEWHYTQAMMAYAFDCWLPAGTTWRDLFDVVIVSARKPDFFSARQPLFEVADDAGLLRPCVDGLHAGGVFLGGDAAQVESYLGAAGEEILYVGDHVFSDVHVSKSLLRWRTCLILRELEDEIEALSAFRDHETRIQALMDEKSGLEAEHARLRLSLLRRHHGREDRGSGPTDETIKSRLAELRDALEVNDQAVAPLARASSEVGNPTWGPMLRSGNEKSHLAHQVERYADLYTSRVANFLYATPFYYGRSVRGTLPHDPL